MRSRSLTAIHRFHTLLLLIAALPTHHCTAQPGRQQQRWTGTWAASPCAPPAAGSAARLTFHDETLRLIVHTSIGGDAVRIRLSNTFAADALTVTAAHIAVRDKGSAIQADTDRALTFGGRTVAMVPAGSSVLSDPVRLSLAPLSDVAVSLYLPGDTEPGAVHYDTRATNYSAAGDQTGAATLQGARPLERWPLLTAVEVSSRTPQAAIVALGSSTTDGAHSTKDTNHRWTDYFAVRLQGSSKLKDFGVLNEGIGGNRVLHDGRGPNALSFGPGASARFDRDVLAQAGARYVVILEGGNDINHPGDSAPLSEAITAEDLIAGYHQLTARAHEHGLRVILGTIMPFEGSLKQPEALPQREAIRVAVNRWVLSNSEADGSIDFARSVADPAHPSRFLPAFDSGDHLHPNDAGYKAMSDAVNLGLF